MKRAQLQRAGEHTVMATMSLLVVFTFLAALAGGPPLLIMLVFLSFIVGGLCAARLAVIAMCQLEYEERHPGGDAQEAA